MAPQDAGVASATVTVGQQLGASVGTSLLNTIFAGAVAAYLAAHLAAARLIGRPALTGLALAHGYDTAFWWTAGIFAAGAVTGGALLRPGPLARQARRPPHRPGCQRPQPRRAPLARHDPGRSWTATGSTGTGPQPGLSDFESRNENHGPFGRKEILKQRTAGDRRS